MDVIGSTRVLNTPVQPGATVQMRNGSATCTPTNRQKPCLQSKSHPIPAISHVFSLRLARFGCFNLAGLGRGVEEKAAADCLWIACWLSVANSRVPTEPFKEPIKRTSQRGLGLIGPEHIQGWKVLEWSMNQGRHPLTDPFEVLAARWPDQRPGSH
jgi:hypothetical protein